MYSSLALEDKSELGGQMVICVIALLVPSSFRSKRHAHSSQWVLLRVDDLVIFLLKGRVLIFTAGSMTNKMNQVC